MSINIQQILDFPGTVHLVTHLGRLVPPAIAYPISEVLAAWVAARRSSRLTRAVRVNQWAARGAASEYDLDLAVRETLKQNARDLYTLYHNLHRPENIENKILIDHAIGEILERPRFDQCGLIIAGLHLSIFDLVLQYIFRQKFEAMVLTLPDPQGARHVEYERRKRAGAEIVTTSLTALRHVVKHLQRGGMVITGIDRPIYKPKHCPRFFGYPAALPTHHIWLALQAHVPIIVMAVMPSADGNYRLMSSKPISMEHYPDRGEEIIKNAEHVLKHAEAFIRMDPRQWNVPLPVWPELLDMVDR